MVKPIIGGFDKFEFILDVAFVILFFEGSDDLIFRVDFDGSLRGIHELDKVLKVHLNLFSFE